jgi:hypothetical protein
LLGSNLIRDHYIDLIALGIPTHDLTTLESPFSENEV